MLAVFDSLREFTPLSLLIRLCVALVFGGMIGLNGTRKQRAAGFRTYMLVCMGAALTMLISQYFFIMLQTQWKDLADEMNLTTDVSRFSAQVINGIGFLGAGTVLLTGRQEVKGVTTAAGLWASACMGLAIGAGFIECFIVGFIFIGLIYMAFTKIWGRKPFVEIAALILGLIVCYAFGTGWFMYVYIRDTGEVSLMTVLSWCVLPFIIPDLIKMALAAVISRRVRIAIPQTD